MDGLHTYTFIQKPFKHKLKCKDVQYYYMNILNKSEQKSSLCSETDNCRSLCCRRTLFMR